MTIAFEGNNDYIQALNQERDRRQQLFCMSFRESDASSKKGLFERVRFEKKADR